MQVAVVPTILAIVLFGLLFVPTIVGSILFFSGRPRSGVRRVGGSMMLVCGTVLAGLLILATMLVGYRSAASVQIQQDAMRRADREAAELQRRYTTPPPVVVSPEHRLTAEAIPPELNVDAGLKRLQEAEQPADAILPQAERIEPMVEKPQRPAWTATSESRQGDVRHLVLSSKQYATLDEARQELTADVIRLLENDFRSVFHTSADGLRSLSIPELRSLAVKQEHTETTPTDFGNFTAPMHRVWWQVELSPEVRTKLRALWKEQTQDVRTWIVAGTLIDITVLLAGWSLFTRWRRAAMG